MYWSNLMVYGYYTEGPRGGVDLKKKKKLNSLIVLFFDAHEAPCGHKLGILCIIKV